MILTFVVLSLATARCAAQMSPTAADLAAEGPVAVMSSPPALAPINGLLCPTVPNTDVVLPPPPYDEDAGDCALVGHSAEVEAWLAQLEQIAEECHSNRGPNWESTNAARQWLDLQVDDLHDETQISNEQASTPDTIVVGGLVCGTYGQSESPDLADSALAPSSHYYTNWLSDIGENVMEYCSMIDELIKPLWTACDEINFYLNCGVADPETHHAIIASKMNAAQIKYDYTDFFFTNTLQVAGWGNFRQSYSEALIICARAEPASTPTFTFSMNAFCRKGPSTSYGEVTAFLPDQSVQIDGRNQGETRWWWVLIPGTASHCWVSDSTGLADGLLEDTTVISPPPLPLPTATPTARARR